MWLPRGKLMMAPITVWRFWSISCCISSVSLWFCSGETHKGVYDGVLVKITDRISHQPLCNDTTVHVVPVFPGIHQQINLLPPRPEYRGACTQQPFPLCCKARPPMVATCWQTARSLSRGKASFGAEARKVCLLNSTCGGWRRTCVRL